MGMSSPLAFCTYLFRFGKTKNNKLWYVMHGFKRDMPRTGDGARKGSAESAKAMRRFVQSQLFPDITVQIVCFNRKPKDGEPLLEGARRYCESHGLEVTKTDLVDEHPLQILVSYAQQAGVDLIVLGATSRNRIIQHILGDTVVAAIRESTVPLYLNQ